MKKIYDGDYRERRRKAVAANRAANPERTRRQWRNYRERKLLKATGGIPKPEICDICGIGGKICFDHCHNKGNFRGWICNRCNFVLGQVGDSLELLKKLIEYLEKSQ
jgi:hypothetical protein